MDQYIGKMLDERYEILERIGTGGMAVVYKAKCHRLNRLVAVKILKSDLAQDADFRRRFHAESKAVAMLSHPNIVSVYDVSQSAETEYIVMELIDGITLKQYIEKRGTLNWRESLHFMTQIMKGLSHAHSRGIVHRDIKPQNIMVLRDGSVKVADFGIACLENSAQTLTQEALGSVHYISPEQARGDRTDARSDIYSAGVVFYEMLSGRLPFEGDSAVSVAIQHLSSIPLPPREINPDIPQALELICMRAMAPDISKRYPTADAMVGDLETFRKNPEVDLDYSIADLQDSEPDEPTRHIPTAHRQTPAERDSRRYPEPDRSKDRDYERDYRENQGGLDKKRVAIIAGGVVTACVLVFLLFQFVWGSLKPPEDPTLTVPNLLGMTLEEAKDVESIVDGTFTLQEPEYVYSDEEEGKIFKQDPTEDSSTKTALKIQIWISAGQDTTMPSLAEQEVRLAKELLNAMGLNLQIEEKTQESEEYAEGTVLYTIPAAGERLKQGDKITLVVSEGKTAAPVTVPSFVGMDIEKVKTEKLPQAGLVLGNVYTDDTSTEPKGTIVKQNLENTSLVPEGTSIDFWVSTGMGTGGGAAATTITRTYDLPTDRLTVQVVVEQDGTVVYDQNHDTSFESRFTVSLTGSGASTVEVYFDGVLYITDDVTFG